MHSPILRTSTHSNARLLYRCMHTSPRTKRFIKFPGRAYTAYSCFHGCTLRAARPSGSNRNAPHPCTVTAAHHLHTRPPNARLEYQGSLANTYFSLAEFRASAEVVCHSAFVVTRSGVCIDLPAPPHHVRRRGLSCALPYRHPCSPRSSS